MQENRRVPRTRRSPLAAHPLTQPCTPRTSDTREAQAASVKAERDSSTPRMPDPASGCSSPWLVGQKHRWVTVQKPAFSPWKGSPQPGTAEEEGWHNSPAPRAHSPPLSPRSQMQGPSLDSARCREVLPSRSQASSDDHTWASDPSGNRDPGPVTG